MVKKTQHRRSLPPRQPQRALTGLLQQAQQLVRACRYAEALRLLRPVADRHTHHIPMQQMLALCLHQLHQHHELVPVAERLCQILPTVSNQQLVLQTYMHTEMRAHVVRFTRRLLKQHPDHEKAAELRRLSDSVEAQLLHQSEALGVQGEEALDMQQEMDRVTLLLRLGQLRNAETRAESLVARWPQLYMGWTCLAVARLHAGQVGAALEAVDAALLRQADAPTALAVRLRCLHLLGRDEDVAALGRRALEVPLRTLHDLVAVCEAFSVLGDDAAVRLLWDRSQATQAKVEGESHRYSLALLLHLTAVAIARQGDEAAARELWQMAVNLGSPAGVAENLADLDRGADLRGGPFAMSLHQWLSKEQAATLARVIKDHRHQAAARRDALRQYLAERPEVEVALADLLDRGDPRGRQLALEVAKAAGTPRLLTALRHFATGRFGPLPMRSACLHFLRETGALPRGPVRLWSGGQWQEAEPVTT